EQRRGDRPPDLAQLQDSGPPTFLGRLRGHGDIEEGLPWMGRCFLRRGDVTNNIDPNRMGYSAGLSITSTNAFSRISLPSRLNSASMSLSSSFFFRLLQAFSKVMISCGECSRTRKTWKPRDVSTTGP